MFVLDRFEERDLVRVMELAAQTLPERYSPDFFVKMAHVQPELFRVARDLATGKVQGFILAAQEPGLRGHVLAFAVDPDLQGRGIGRALLRSVQRTLSLRDVKELDLEVRPDNPRALGFYRRQGFAVGGLEERVYKDGADALHLFKPIL